MKEYQNFKEFFKPKINQNSERIMQEKRFNLKQNLNGGEFENSENC